MGKIRVNMILAPSTVLYIIPFNGITHRIISIQLYHAIALEAVNGSTLHIIHPHHVTMQRHDIIQ